MPYLRFNKKKFIFWGLSIVIIIVSLAIIILIFSGLHQYRLTSQLKNNQEVNRLSLNIVNTQAQLLTLMLANKNSSLSLKNSLLQLEKEPFVGNASIYSTQGKVIAQTDSTNIPRLLYQAELTHSTTQVTPYKKQLLLPLGDKKKMYGFLRVTLIKHYDSVQDKAFNKSFRLLYAFYVIAIFATVLLTSTLYYCIRLFNRPKTINKLERKEQNTATDKEEIQDKQANDKPVSDKTLNDTTVKKLKLRKRTHRKNHRR